MSYKSTILADGDIISTVTYHGIKLGIYMGNGFVMHAKSFNNSCVRTILNETMEAFSEGNGISVENSWIAKSKFNAESRMNRAKSQYRNFWGSEYDRNPSESFIRFICEDIAPPDKTAYKYTLAGAAIGFYMGGGFIGAGLGSAIGYFIDSKQ